MFGIWGENQVLLRLRGEVRAKQLVCNVCKHLRHYRFKYDLQLYKRRINRENQIATKGLESLFHLLLTHATDDWHFIAN